MRVPHGTTMVLVLAWLATSCGGSGSTGLVSPENALLDDVRRDENCVTSDKGVTYCATGAPDAVAPNGATAFGPFGEAGAPDATPTPAGVAPTPTPTFTPVGGGATPEPTPGSAASASPGAGSPTPAATPPIAPTPCVSDLPEACPDGIFLSFDVLGLPAGAACALAARELGSEGAWRTAELVPAGGAMSTVVALVPSVPGAIELEIALLCFEVAPVPLPAEIATLADADPDVVFVPDAVIEVF